MIGLRFYFFIIVFTFTYPIMMMADDSIHEQLTLVKEHQTRKACSVCFQDHNTEQCMLPCNQHALCERCFRRWLNQFILQKRKRNKTTRGLAQPLISGQNSSCAMGLCQGQPLGKNFMLPCDQHALCEYCFRHWLHQRVTNQAAQKTKLARHKRTLVILTRVSIGVLITAGVVLLNKIDDHLSAYLPK